MISKQQARKFQVVVGAIKKIKQAGCGCQVGGEGVDVASFRSE